MPDEGGVDVENIPGKGNSLIKSPIPSRNCLNSVKRFEFIKRYGILLSPAIASHNQYDHASLLGDTDDPNISEPGNTIMGLNKYYLERKPAP